MSKVFPASALRTLSNVARDRQRSASDLIFQCEVLAFRERIENIHRKATSTLPNFQIFKRLISHTENLRLKTQHYLAAACSSSALSVFSQVMSGSSIFPK